MPQITLVERLKLRFETDLADEELQRIIDAENTEVAQRFGPHSDTGAPVTEVIPAYTPGLLFLSQPAVSIISVQTTTYAGVTTLLDPTMYRGWYGNRVIESVNPYWTQTWGWPGTIATVTYVPLDDGNQRQEVILKLAILTLQYRGLNSERTGDYNATNLDYTKERSRLLQTLWRGPLVI